MHRAVLCTFKRNAEAELEKGVAIVLFKDTVIAIIPESATSKNDTLFKDVNLLKFIQFHWSSSFVIEFLPEVAPPLKTPNRLTSVDKDSV